MVVRFLKIRLQQLLGIVRQIGIIRAVFLTGLFSLTILYIYIITVSGKSDKVITGAYILPILLIHLRRKDRVFINLYSEKPYIIFFVEYLLLSMPLIISLTYCGLWYNLSAFVILLFIISVLKINIRKSSINTVFQKIIPDENFEWKSGVRKNLLILVPIWLSGISFSFYVASVPVAIFILGIIVLNFYETPEPLQILIAEGMSAKEFLSKKIKNNFSIFSALILPLVFSYMIFNIESYYIPLIEYLMFSVLLIYTIVLKYAFYMPNIKSGASQIFTMIGIISIFIPVFIPVILLLSIKFLFQAYNNLNFYLHDFD